MTYRYRVYWHGAVAAALGGFANSVVVVMVAPDRFNLASGPAALHLLIVAVAAAIFGFFTYIKDHPLPDPVKDVDFQEAAQAAVSAVVAKNTGTGAGTGDGGPPTGPINLKLE